MQRQLAFALIFTATLPVLFTRTLKAQGCSDAGVCTAGPMGELHVMSDSTVVAKEPRHMARLAISYGAGEQGTAILQVVPEIALGLTENWGVQFKCHT